MELTAKEAVGPGSWLDLMCALRVEPNVVNAPAAAYEPNPVCTLYECMHICLCVCMYFCVYLYTYISQVVAIVYWGTDF